MARTDRKSRAAIVGGGVGGLACAYYLVCAGVEVHLFEAEQEVGGLARSFDLDGLRVERYYHFICLPDKPLIKLGGELDLFPVFQKTRTTFFYQGRLYPFTSPADLLRFDPIPFASRLNMGLEAVKWERLKKWEKLDAIPARDWLIKRLGRKTYDVVWHPLLSMKFGNHYDKVSAAWLWHRVHRVAKSRKSLLHPQQMGYFPGGTEVLLNALSGRITDMGGRISTSTPVESVIKKSDGKLTVRGGGEDKDFDAVLLAAPLPQSAPLLPAEMSGFRERLERISFLGVVCLVVQTKETISESFWCNIHDERLPLNGIIEMSQLNPATGKNGHLIYVPYYLPVDSPRFSLSEEELVEEFKRCLDILKPGAGSDFVISARVFRSELAQAICTTGFLDLKPPYYTGMRGLYFLDSTQLYPEDRTLSGTVEKAEIVSRMMLDYLGAER